VHSLVPQFSKSVVNVKLCIIKDRSLAKKLGQTQWRYTNDLARRCNIEFLNLFGGRRLDQ
jgi:hypothetical protein